MRGGPIGADRRIETAAGGSGVSRSGQLPGVRGVRGSTTAPFATGFAVFCIGPREKRKLTPDNLRGVDLYAQPGGDGSLEDAMRSLGPSAARAIPDYVASGGHYVGFCMGAYLAGSDPAMELLGAGDTRGYDPSSRADVTGRVEAIIPVRWGGSVRYHYAQDPSYIVPSKVRGERVLSRFTNGTINALVRPFYRGGVGVVGTHPEADRSRYTDRLWHEDNDGLDHAQVQELITAVMKTPSAADG